MRVALSIWNGRISPVFDVARRVLLVTVENGDLTGRVEKSLDGSDPLRQAKQLAELEPDVLICGAVSRPLVAFLAASGIRLFPFSAGATEEVLAAYLAGKLPHAGLSMPGCCRRRGRPRRGGGANLKAESVIVKGKNMKVMVTSSGPALTDAMDPRFGRARRFLLVDTETGALSVHDNEQNLNAAQGAGIQAAETVVRLGADAVISGHVGPKAFRVLSAAGIPVHLAQAGTVQAAVDLFKEGRLPPQTAADVDGHW